MYAVPIKSVSETSTGVGGFGTQAVQIIIDDSVTIGTGTLFVNLLVKQSTFPLPVSSTSSAHVFYRYIPYQTLNNLPDTLSVEIVKGSDFVYVSNLGTGGDITRLAEPYENPIDHIPVNDTNFINENVFCNLDDLDLSNMRIDSGFIKLPAYIGRVLGKNITLSDPNNVGDKIGRPYYSSCSEVFKIQTEGLSFGNQRKVFVPMLARIRSDVTTPFVRGELVMLIFSKYFKARTENEIGFYKDTNVEYQPGYFEEVLTSVGVYRLENKPIVRI
jgi:hypothetical protein